MPRRKRVLSDIACVCRHVLLPFLTIWDIVQVRGANREQYKAVTESPDVMQMVWKRQALLARFHPAIIRLMGGYRKMAGFPELPWQPHFVGSSGSYQINPQRMTHAVMLGIDLIYDRPFVAMRFRQTSNRNPRREFRREFRGTHAETLYQCTAAEGGTWANCSCGGTTLSIGARGMRYFLKDGLICDALLPLNINNLLAERGKIFHTRWRAANLNVLPPQDLARVLLARQQEYTVVHDVFLV